MCQTHLASGERTGEGCLIKHLTYVCVLGWCFITGSALALTEDETSACMKAPNVLCLTELAEASLDEAKGFISQDALRHAIALSYLKEGDYAGAEANVRKMVVPETRLPASLEIAIRYWQNQQYNASNRLFEDVYRQVDEAETLSCPMRMQMLYKTALNQSHLKPGEDLISQLRMPELLREALYLAQLHAAVAQEKYAQAATLLKKIHTPFLKDEAIFQYLERYIRKKPFNELEQWLTKISSDAKRKDFLQWRLPSAYLEIGQYEEAIARAHKIDDLARKVRAFDRIIAKLTAIHDESQARRLLQFNHDFTKLLKGKEKFEALLHLAERYQALDHPTVARNILTRAIAMAKDEPLQYRAKALNDIMATQNTLADTKGLRLTAINALKEGYLQSYDEVADLEQQPELIALLDRYFLLLDGHLAPYDRLLFIRETLQLNQSFLRWHILNQLKKVGFSKRIDTHKPLVPFEIVHEQVKKHLFTMERSMMETLLAGTLLLTDQVTQAKAMFERVRSYLRLDHIKSHLPMPLFMQRKDTAWRVLALEELRTNDPRQSLKDYARATSDDPDLTFWLQQLMHHRGAKYTLDFTDFEQAVALATTDKSYKEILNYVEINRSEERRENLIRMLNATYATGNWDNVAQVLDVIQKYDREFSFFVWERILRSNEQALIPAFVRGFVAMKKPAQAAAWAYELENLTERARQLMVVAGALPASEALAPLPALYPMEKGVITQICGEE